MVCGYIYIDYCVYYVHSYSFYVTVLLANDASQPIGPPTISMCSSATSTPSLSSTPMETNRATTQTGDDDSSSGVGGVVAGCVVGVVVIIIIIVLLILLFWYWRRRKNEGKQSTELTS